MGVEGKFLQIIKAIYSKQEAMIKVNGNLTESISIEQGTRQGCPLSPLLFILILEILNRQIRANERVKGLKIRGEEFKVQAYADDLVIILENPHEDLDEVLRIIEDYGLLAGLKNDYQKTKVMIKNIKKEEGNLVKENNFEEVQKII